MSIVTNEANFNSLLSSSSTPSRISQSVSFTATVFVTPRVTSKQHSRTPQNAWFRELTLPGAPKGSVPRAYVAGRPKCLVPRTHVTGRPKRLGSSRSTRCRAPQKAWFREHTLPGAGGKKRLAKRFNANANVSDSRQRQGFNNFSLVGVFFLIFFFYLSSQPDRVLWTHPGYVYGSAGRSLRVTQRLCTATGTVSCRSPFGVSVCVCLTRDTCCT